MSWYFPTPMLSLSTTDRPRVGELDRATVNGHRSIYKYILNIISPIYCCQIVQFFLKTISLLPGGWSVKWSQLFVMRGRFSNSLGLVNKSFFLPIIFFDKIKNKQIWKYIFIIKIIFNKSFLSIITKKMIKKIDRHFQYILSW